MLSASKAPRSLIKHQAPPSSHHHHHLLQFLLLQIIFIILAPHRASAFTTRQARHIFSRAICRASNSIGPSHAVVAGTAATRAPRKGSLFHQPLSNRATYASTTRHTQHRYTHTSTQLPAAAAATGDASALPPVVEMQDLQRVASFFPADAAKDNSTAFFHSLPGASTFPEAIEAALQIPLDRATKLHEIGAVYVHRGGKFRRTRNLTDFPPSGPIEKDLVRVYLYPRRFPACVTDYQDRVVWENKDLLVLDKPPGCPCSLHVSNALESLDMAAAASLGIPLIRMNRLDTVTTGLVCVAKTKHGATIFWEEIRRERVGKTYKALVTGPVSLGILDYYMPGRIIHRRPAPRAISKQPLEGWKLCQTRVLSCVPIMLPAALAREEDESGEGKEQQDGEAKQTYYEVEAELITGRTHQLRATFAAEGAPIVHDTMYIPLKSFLLNDEDDPAIQEIYPRCAEPQANSGIGLQCSSLSFLGVTVTAGKPWWRTEESKEEKEGGEGE